MANKTCAVIALHLIGALLSACGGGGSGAPPEAGQDDRDGFPPSDVITGVTFHFDTLVQRAEGSDNWAITWADDGSQYTTWGDGGGFGGSDQNARVSLGVARIRGEPQDFTTQNVWGGKNSLAEATFTGKNYGILALGTDLWLWRTGTESTVSAFEQQDLFVSHDNGLTFESPIGQLAERSAYEFFTGLDSRGTAGWSSDIGERAPVFRDPENGVMLVSASADNFGLVMVEFETAMD